MSTRFIFSTLILFILPSLSLALPKVTTLGERSPDIESNVLRAAEANLDLTTYRELRLQYIKSLSGSSVDHAVIYLLSAKYHKVEFASADLDQGGHVTGFHTAYTLTDADHSTVSTTACPDASTEFIAFAPNDDDLEQQITEQVALAAEAKGLKTVRLVREEATGANYMSYMSCPNLKGNFYDGDAAPDLITTVDGTLSATQIRSLNGAFRNAVTNIWLACEAFNDPMLGAVVNGAKSQYYAAGINNLEIGPSDKTGACAMISAIAGKSISKSFSSCYKKYDNANDHWGNKSSGADFMTGTTTP